MRITLKSLAIGTAIAGSSLWFLWQHEQALRPSPSRTLEVSFLDVGQGDSIYIHAPNGRSMLIDGGPDGKVVDRLRALGSFSNAATQTNATIDMVMETHPDKDHIAGLVKVFEQYEVKKLLRSEISSGTSFDRSLDQHAKDEPGLETIIARRGQRIFLDKQDGVYVDILFPDQDTSHFKETNEASIVARLVYGTTSFLLTGDSPINVENFLAEYDGPSLRTTALKLGHHGSKTSSGDAYLESVQPEYAVISAGKNNRYHHPSPETMERVTAHHIRTISTVDQGTITFQTDGQSLWVKQK